MFSSRNILFFLIFYVLFLTVLYSALSIVRHNHFESGGFDLGLYDQTVWQYSKFLYPYSSIKERFILRDHLTLTLPLLGGLFYIWDDVRILLIFQAFWISFSTIAVYKILLHRKFFIFTSLTLSIVYSLFYAIQYTVFFDFHPVIIAAGLIPWFVYYLEAKKKILSVLILGLILLTQENMGITITSLGLLYIFRRNYKRIAILVIITGIAYSIIAFGLISYFSYGRYEYTPKIFGSLPEIFYRFFDSWEKLQSWFYSLISYSSLPFLSIGTIFSVLLETSQYFITGDDLRRMWSPFTHHRLMLAFLLLLGAANSLEMLRRKNININFIAVILLISALFQQYFFHLPLNKLSKSIYWQEERWMIDNRDLIKEIPANFSIVTQQNLIPHLSHRKEIYIAWVRKLDNKCGKKSCWWLDFSGKPEYLVVDRRPHQWITQILETNENFQSAISNMEKEGTISLVKNINKAYLYKINDNYY